MATVPLLRNNAGTLDASGNATVALGPDGQGEVWTASGVSVQCSSNTKEATCKILLGQNFASASFIDITVDGSTGDVTDLVASYPISKGWYIYAVWSGGDVGATATVTAIGTSQVP